MRFIRYFFLTACASFTLSNSYAMDDDHVRKNVLATSSLPAGTENEWQFEGRDDLNLGGKDFSKGLKIVPPKKKGVHEIQIAKNPPQKCGAKNCTGQIYDLGVSIHFQSYPGAIAENLEDKKMGVLIKRET